MVVLQAAVDAGRALQQVDDLVERNVGWGAPQRKTGRPRRAG